MLIVTPIVGVQCLFLPLLCNTVYPDQFCNHLDEEERNGCFTLIDFLMSCDFIVLRLFLTVLCVGLQSVIVVFPDHTHLFVWLRSTVC